MGGSHKDILRKDLGLLIGSSRVLRSRIYNALLVVHVLPRTRLKQMVDDDPIEIRADTNWAVWLELK